MDRARHEERLAQWRLPSLRQVVTVYEARGVHHSTPHCPNARGSRPVRAEYRDIRASMCRNCPAVDGGRPELYHRLGEALPDRRLPEDPERFEEVFAHLEQLESIRAELHAPELHQHLAEVNLGVRAGWEWLDRDEVRAALTETAVERVTSRDGSPAEMWYEKHLLTLQQHHPGQGRWLLVPFWRAQRGTLWLAHAPLAVAQLVEDEQPGNVEVVGVPTGTPDEVLETTAALWRDGGTYEEAEKALAAATALHGR